jgi:hypothetical protein
MEKSSPTLLWGIDNETGKINALPASPLLLPAFIVYCIAWLLSLFPKRTTGEPLPCNFDQDEFNKNKKEYDYYCMKIRKGIELTSEERHRLNAVLPRPSWSKPGENWHY